MYTKKSFQNLIDYWGERTPEKEAINDGYRRMSYGELNDEIHQIASALSLRDIQKGDKVMILMPNWHEFIVVFFALSKLGAIVVPCNCALKGKELKERMEIIKPKAVFVSDQAHLTWLRKNYEQCTIFTTRFKEDHYFSYSDLLNVDDLLILGEKSIFEQANIEPEKDVFVIMFTSGSTGTPKGVELTFHNLFQAAKKIGFRLKYTDQDIFLVPLPCGHMFGMIVGVLIPLFFGGKIVLMEKHCATKALDLIEQEQITVHYGVPTMFIRELEEYKHHKTDISSLKTGIVAGAYSPESMIRQVYNDFHCELMIGYGSTETVTISMTSLEDDFDKRIESVGRIFEDDSIKVIDTNGNPVELGNPGELLFKGNGLMKGYYKMPAETKKAIDEDGWFHTGDIVTVDPSGYIKIVGRKKDLIIRGGNNISPAEVEEVYYSHPSVLDVCVLGISDPILGEKTYTYLTLKENSVETEDSLKNYAVGKIAKYKIPDRIIILDIMPKLETGKIDKQVLLEYELQPMK